MWEWVMPKFFSHQPLMPVWCARRDSNPHDVTHCHLKAARLPVPPRALGRPALRLAAGRINGADVTNREWGYKARERLDSVEIWARSRFICCPGSAAASV